MNIRKTLAITAIFMAWSLYAQTIPSDHVIPTNKLHQYLKGDVLKAIGKNKPSSEVLANYFRIKFSERYFYDWRTFEERFEQYNQWYPNVKKSHSTRGNDHLSKYNADTKWVLPFDYLNGEPVNAYALRHLARQHKMVDIAYQYFYQKNPESIAYFTDQMKSLNKALEIGAYERISDGNGVYEAFRSGYRVLNWLRIHNMFLATEEYSNEDQLTTIATLLQHGAHLYARNQEFKDGNHQTRGLSALAMISILFRDFEGTDKWYEKAMELLEMHLRKEINEDGFQFERTVHYHKSDIGNYYYVYQLAKLSGIPVKEFWATKLKDLFITLAKIAFPDKTAPVLQDDTEDAWAEFNNISLPLTLGYLLFEDAEMGYFAEGVVAESMYWYLNGHQLKLLNNILQKQPEYMSLSFPQTGYYINREGWDINDKVMVISAGLDDKKPDHQHGDMLGIQAYANGQVILPNYQVRYPLPDLELFKNSMVKNVALVDDELQGKNYTSNKGGSGFGKFRKLPDPNTISWMLNDSFDLYVGEHNGFEDVGVTYSRQVIYVHDDFWIVKDNFESNEKHTFKQVWQGHYTAENGAGLLRTTFTNGSGLDIYQLKAVDAVEHDGQRGKGRSIVKKEDSDNFSFITLVYPFKTYDRRVDELSDKPNFIEWKQNSLPDFDTDKEALVLSRNRESFMFGVSQIKLNTTAIDFNRESDMYISLTNKDFEIQNIGTEKVNFEVLRAADKKETISINPGEKKVFKR